MIRTLAYTGNILGVCGIPLRPVVHFDMLPLCLGLPDSIHQHVDSALARHMGVAVQDGYPERDGQPLLACLGEFLENGPLAVQLGLAVQVRRLGRGVDLVRSISRHAGEYVVCRDVDEDNIPGCRLLRDVGARSNVDGLCPLRILVNLVW